MEHEDGSESHSPAPWDSPAGEGLASPSWQEAARFTAVFLTDHYTTDIDEVIPAL